MEPRTGAPVEVEEEGGDAGLPPPCEGQASPMEVDDEEPAAVDNTDLPPEEAEVDFGGNFGPTPTPSDLED